MTREISNSDDVIDSRDVIARIEELRGVFEALAAQDDEDATVVEVDNIIAEHAADDGAELHDEAVELTALESFAEDAQQYCEDWKHGGTLIRDSYFEEYAQQFAEDMGAIDDSARWPCTCIDWKRAAGELQMDYTSVDFDGVTYWIR